MKRTNKIIMIFILFIFLVFTLKSISLASVNVNKEVEIFQLENSNLITDIENQTTNKNLELNIEKKEYLDKSINLSNYRSLSETTNMGQIYSNYEPIFMEHDKENIYYLGYYATDSYTLFQIEKQNIQTKEIETILTKGQYGTTYQDEPYYPVAHYQLGNIIYVECYIKEDNVTQYDKVTVFGFDIISNSVIYEKEFAVCIDSSDEYCSFAVDNEQRFYFVNDFTEIIVYDKEGNLHYDSNITLDDSVEVIINSVSPDGKVLFFSVNQYRKSSLKYTIYQGIQELKDGRFVNTTTYTVTNANGKDPFWHFIDENNEYAINQYGEIAKFSYDTGVSYQVITSTNKFQYDYYYGDANKWPLYVMNENYIYIMGSENQIYIFDRNNNFEYVGRINGFLGTDEESVIVENITKVDNQVNIFYTTNYILYLKTINLDDQSIISKKDITYNTHISQTYTKDEIQSKFDKSNVFDYTKSIYISEPSIVVPYYEGVLNETVVSDTLNRINFYRWIYGINEVTLNRDKLARNQKGALVQKINNVLTHYPTQPEGMSDDFYKEAYDGCSAKWEENDIYSGNCASDVLPLNMHIDGYVDDINNRSDNGVTTDAVGHRWSMLDPNAYAASFGYVSPYSTVSMYFNEEIELKENFYALPTAGNFPSELFRTNERWSIYFSDNVNFNENYKLEIIYNGRSYSASDFRVEVTQPAITFLMPDELVTLLGGTGKTMPECTITVKLTGVTNNNFDNLTYQYDVTFFKFQSDLLKGDVNKDGEVKLYDALQILKQAILGGELTEDELYIMDYNDDGEVTLYDALKFLQQAILG